MIVLRRGSSAAQLSAKYDEQIEQLSRHSSEQARRDALAVEAARASTAAAEQRAVKAEMAARSSRTVSDELAIVRAAAAEASAASAARERALTAELSELRKQLAHSNSQPHDKQRRHTPVDAHAEQMGRLAASSAAQAPAVADIFADQVALDIKRGVRGAGGAVHGAVSSGVTPHHSTGALVAQ